MGQVGSRTWVDGDGFVAARLVQIGDGSLRKKEGSVGLWCGRKKGLHVVRKKEEMERH